MESAILRDDGLYHAVMRRISPSLPGQQEQGYNESASTNGATALDALVAKAIDQLAGLDTEGAKQSLSGIVQQAAELGSQKALQQIAPALNAAQQTTLDTQWDKQRQMMLEKAKVDILSPAEVQRLNQARTELVARLQLPPDCIVAPDVLVKYAYSDVMHAAGQFSQQDFQQKRIQAARQAAGTARPGPATGAPTARPRDLAGYIERARSAAT